MGDDSNDNSPESTEQTREKEGFFVVGLGASAGGIKAFKEFFAHVPHRSGMAYVVILHMSPEHESRLTEILQLTTLIPVTQVVETVRIEPDHVYVIPPNRSLSMRDGHLALSEMTRREERRSPVDIFFRSLAESNDSRAICVVLSGTGANGSMGLKRIKEFGGIVFAQDPAEAEYNDMPRNAIATGLVDYVMPVAQMPAKIIAYKDHLAAVRISTEPLERHETDEEALRDIFTQLRVRTGHDFTNYKLATVLRRIERRINVYELPDLQSYALLMRESPEESSTLVKDLLISVTNFFRDSGTYQALENNIIPKLFEGKRAGDNVRVWVAGCATGEEAYSIAMLLAEYASSSVNAPTLQLFATDLDERSIAVAREGFYTNAEVADISPERLRRFFTKDGEGNRVRRELRGMVLFSTHNIIRDPPFSQLDLVSCRNLLIYLNRPAQERVMEVLHYALHPGGYLFLGRSESIYDAGDLFTTVDKDHHIFQRRTITSRMFLPLPKLSPQRTYQRHREECDEVRAHDRLSYFDLHLRLLEQFGPPSVLVNENYDIVYLSERAGQYMLFAGGEPTHNLLRVVRPELRMDLRTALYQAVQRRTKVEARGVYVSVNGNTHTVNLIVRPVMRDDDPARGLILVIFEEAQEKEEMEEPPAIDAISQAEPVAHPLEEELLRVKAQLRATIEQYEIQHEELQTTNEELQAMNEELRSTAEELETGKEELQSVNEELVTVNQELKIKIEELSQANNDFQNLMASTGVGTIFLDRSFNIKLFTPRACDIYNLIPSDVNRPLMDITTRLLYADLIEDVEQVLNRLQPVEHEVQTRDGAWYLVRLVPYRTKEDRIDGVVITFIDTTSRKAATETLRRTRDEMELRVKERTGDLQTANDALRNEVTERRIAAERARGLLRRIITAQEDERSRIARNLHDHLGQQLTALRLKLETVKDRGGNRTELNQAVEQAQIIAEQLDIDVDFLSWELRPVSLDRLPLVTALSDFVHEWSKHFDIPAEFHTSDMEIGRFPENIETNLYRIAQEALNNIYKHAQATRVDVIFERREDHIVLIIEDNGQGFDINRIAVHSGEEKEMGLIGMRERAALVGGTLEIESQPGDGTTIIVRAPISSAGEESS
jgi:two-component system, chemotaxis family, CheB/CheR fusion protein